MNWQWRGIFMTIALVFMCGILVRLFPLVARLGEVAALGLREFWLGILIVALSSYLVWFFRKRPRR